MSDTEEVKKVTNSTSTKRKVTIIVEFDREVKLIEETPVEGVCFLYNWPLCQVPKGINKSRYSFNSVAFATEEALKSIQNRKSN